MLVARQETISARASCSSLGYARWENFDGLLKRAEHLINSGEALGRIRRTMVPVTIGSGAVRRVRDYLMDPQAFELVRALSSSMKLTKKFSVRNECAILRLLEKYCRAKNLHFEFQKRWRGVVFDALIERAVAIEFDEPHHQRNVRQRVRDKAKDHLARESQVDLLRFTVSDDIVDVILAVERAIRRLGPDRRTGSSEARHN